MGLGRLEGEGFPVWGCGAWDLGLTTPKPQKFRGLGVWGAGAALMFGLSGCKSRVLILVIIMIMNLLLCFSCLSIIVVGNMFKIR